MTTGVGGCGGGCGRDAHALVPARRVLERESLTPRQAAAVAQRDGTYQDWVSDVPVQGPTDPGIRAAGCWWKNNVLDRVTDHQGAMVPRWTQSSALCFGNQPTGVGGVSEAIYRGGARVGALGQSPTAITPVAAPAAAAPPGLWSNLSDSESQWVAATLTQLNALILKAGNRPCATWPADPTKNMPAAVACFQGWYNTNANGSIRTDGTLDRATLCALVAVTKQHAADFPRSYPGPPLLCLSTLPIAAKIGLGIAAAAVVGGAVAAIASASGKEKKKTPPPSASPAQGG